MLTAEKTNAAKPQENRSMEAKSKVTEVIIR
jgi:hypothetical protein